MAFHYLTARVSDLTSTYKALQGETGQTQNAATAIDKLCDRLANSESSEERRSALLSIKGLSRDYKLEAGNAVLPILLQILELDAPADPELAKVVLETLNVLCETDEQHSSRSREITPGMRNTDRFLATEKPLHALLQLLTQPHFYVRYFSLQLLGTLLSTRPDPVQKQVLTAPGGLGSLVEVLEDKREIVRNEGLLLMISLTSTNAEIQKIVAFVGAFERLFKIINLEGGITAGGIVVQDCLSAIIGLLRYNASNQNFFRENNCIPHVAPLLQFPPISLLSSNSPEATHALELFADQYWPEQKLLNALSVIQLIQMLVAGAGEGRSSNQKALLKEGVSRCLTELALASNAPPTLKAAALNALSEIVKGSPVNQDMLTSLHVQPLIPIYLEQPQQANGTEEGEQIEWQRAQPVPAILALIALAVQGDPGLGQDAGGVEGIKVRAAAVGLFENYVANNPDVQVNLVTEMKPPEKTMPATPPQTGGAVLLAGLRAVPSALTSQMFDSHAPFFSSLMFTQLLRNTESCKRIARENMIASDSEVEPASQGEDKSAEDEDASSLMQVLVGNLVLAQREQTTCANNVHANPVMDALALEWSRVMVGYMIVLSVWCWESPRSVREFLSESANLQVLIRPISEASGVDSLVQGLCAYVLGILYEYNREAGTIDRQAMHPILQSRVGPDQFANKISRLREDVRFKNVGPDVLELLDADDSDQEWRDDGFWFDWPFVEFVRNNYLSVQRAILLDPGSTEATRNASTTETAELISNLRITIASKSKDLSELQQRVVEIDSERATDRKTSQDEKIKLEADLATAQEALTSLQASTREKLAQNEEQLATLNSQLTLAKSELEKATSANNAACSTSHEPSSDKDSELERLKEELIATQSKLLESEKEQEDLLVLLEEVTSKRKADKSRMRDAGMDVSEDDDDDGDNEEEETDSLK